MALKYVSSVAVFNSKGEILFGQRSDDDGSWTLPGGHAEEDETPEECAARELWEEAGLRPAQIGYIGAGRLKGQNGHDYIVSAFRAYSDEKPSSENDPDEECEEWEWIHPDSDRFKNTVLPNLYSKKNVVLVFLGLQPDVDFLEDTALDDSKEVADLKIESLGKSIADIGPGEQVLHPNLANPAWESLYNRAYTTHDFSHNLPIPMRSKYRVLVQDHPTEGTRNGVLHAHVLSADGTSLGMVKANILENGTKLKIGHARLDPQHRGKGLGTAAYEALMAHALNSRGTRVVAGDTHSTNASKTHAKISAKHGLDYKPKKHKLSAEELAAIAANPKQAAGSFDDKFKPYQYLIKHDAVLTPDDFVYKFINGATQDREELVKHPGITPEHWTKLLDDAHNMPQYERANVLSYAHEHPQGWKPLIDEAFKTGYAYHYMDDDRFDKPEDHHKFHYVLDQLKEKDPAAYKNVLQGNTAENRPLAERHIDDALTYNQSTAPKIYRNSHLDISARNEAWHEMTESQRNYQAVDNNYLEPHHWQEVADNFIKGHYPLHQLWNSAPSSKHVLSTLNAAAPHQQEDAYAHGGTWKALTRDGSLGHHDLWPHMQHVKTNQLMASDIFKLHSDKLPRQTIEALVQQHPALLDIHKDQAYELRLAPGNEVEVRPNASKLRDLRAMLEQSPNGKLHNKELKARGIDLGQMGMNTVLDPHGFVTHAGVSGKIDAIQPQKFNWTDSQWSGAQTHSSSGQKVFQLNATPDLLDKMKENGTYRTFKNARISAHPGHETRGLGWVRYTEHPERGIHIDEIQTDLGKNRLARLKSKPGSEEDASKFAKLHDTLWGKQEPSELIHEAFLQHLRDNGKVGTPIHTWTPESKASISLPASDKALPAHFIETYGNGPKKLGYKPTQAGYGSGPTQDNPAHISKPTQSRILTKTEQALLDVLMKADKTEHQEVQGGVPEPQLDVERLNIDHNRSNSIETALRNQNLHKGPLPANAIKEILKTGYAAMMPKNVADQVHKLSPADWAEVTNHKLEIAKVDLSSVFDLKDHLGKVPPGSHSQSPETMKAMMDSHDFLLHREPHIGPSVGQKVRDAIGAKHQFTPDQLNWLTQNPHILGDTSGMVSTHWLNQMQSEHLHKILRSDGLRNMSDYSQSNVLENIVHHPAMMNHPEKAQLHKQFLDTLLQPHIGSYAARVVAPEMKALNINPSDEQIVSLLNGPDDTAVGKGLSLWRPEHIMRAGDKLSDIHLRQAMDFHDLKPEHIGPNNYMRGWLNDPKTFSNVPFDTIRSVARQVTKPELFEGGEAFKALGLKAFQNHLMKQVNQHHAAQFWNSYESDVEPHHFAVGEKVRSGTLKPVTLTDHRGKSGSSEHWGDIEGPLRQHAANVQQAIMNDANIPKVMINGEHHIPVYRGVAGNYAKALQDAKLAGATHVDVPNAPFSSWSTDPKQADGFSKRYIEGHAPYSALIRRWAPVSEVLHSGYHDVFKGQHHEHPQENEIVFQHPDPHLRIPAEDLSTHNDRQARGQHDAMINDHYDWAWGEPNGSDRPIGQLSQTEPSNADKQFYGPDLKGAYASSHGHMIYHVGAGGTGNTEEDDGGHILHAVPTDGSNIHYEVYAPNAKEAAEELKSGADWQYVKNNWHPAKE